MIYMVVTNKKSELPIYVADTVRELSKLLGFKSATVSHHIYYRTVTKRIKHLKERL